jgi:hypothetical protein
MHVLMSATNRGAKRENKDNYPTPSWAVELMIKQASQDFDVGDRWLEPCVGDGNIIKTVNSCRHAPPIWTGYDIRQECYPPLNDLYEQKQLSSFSICDFLNEPISDQRWDVTFTNPPFKLWEEFLNRSLQVSRTTVLLLRLNAIEGIKRSKWLSKNMPDIYVLPRRPQFKHGISPKTGKPYGTDATAYAWMVWRSGIKKSSGNIILLDV